MMNGQIKCGIIHEVEYYSPIKNTDTCDTTDEP